MHNRQIIQPGLGQFEGGLPPGRAALEPDLGRPALRTLDHIPDPAAVDPRDGHTFHIKTVATFVVHGGREWRPSPDRMYAGSGGSWRTKPRAEASHQQWLINAGGCG